MQGRVIPSSRKSCLILLFVLALIIPGSGDISKKRPFIQSNAAELRLSGFARHLQMKTASPYKDLKWQFLGPTNVSGRCTDVAVVAPKGKNYTIYAATASGGLWKTDNEGTTWKPIFEQGPSTSIGDVTIAPSDPKIVWLGTGEANIYRSSQAGCGVYKSLDGGASWQHMGLSDTYTIPRIVIHPKNPDIVYVAASGHEWTRNPERGVFQTKDGGNTWRKILSGGDEAGAIDLVMDPTDSSTLYAALWQRTRLKWNDPRNSASSSQSGIFKTTDGGKTWKSLAAGLPPAKFRGRIGLDISLSNPAVLYALADDYEISRQPTPAELANPYGVPSCGYIKGATVYRSADRGETWNQVSGLTEQMKKFMAYHSGTYGWVFGQIRVDPTDENTVYLMGIWLSVSNDGGKTFRTLQGMHVDHHGLWIDPGNPNYLVNANDGGIAISYDRGQTWRCFTDNLPAGQFYNVAYDMAQPFHVLGSMQDHGSFRGPVDLNRGRDKIQPQTFESVAGGEAGNHAVDPGDPNTVYSGATYGWLSRSDLGQKSEKEILPLALPDQPKLRGQWLAPFIISSHNPDILYHGMQYVFHSSDRGDTWERISPDLTTNNSKEMGDIRYHTIFTIAESPLIYGLLYAGTDDGRAWLTKNNGGAWHEISTGLAEQKWVSRIAASACAMGTVYLTQNGKRDDDFTPYVWKSTDFGRTWKDISKGIPLGPVNVIREDPVNGDILYLGTDGGAYVSADGGASWNVLGGNLPAAYVHDLIIHPRDNVIVIATHGRGMWALDAEPLNHKTENEEAEWEDD